MAEIMDFEIHHGMRTVFLTSTKYCALCRRDWQAEGGDVWRNRGLTARIGFCDVSARAPDSANATHQHQHQHEHEPELFIAPEGVNADTYAYYPFEEYYNVYDDTTIENFLVKNSHGEPVGDRVRIVYDWPHDTGPLRYLHFVHTSCWQVVRQLDSKWTFPRLFRLAEQTLPLVPRGCRDNALEFKAALSGILPPGFPMPTDDDDTDNNDAAPQHLFQKEFSTETQVGSEGSLTSLIHGAVTRLPLEIQRQIARHIDDGLASCLLRTIETAMTVDNVLRPQKKKKQALVVNPSTGPNSQVGGLLTLRPRRPTFPQAQTLLVARTITLFGVTYLQRLRPITISADDRLEMLRKQEDRRRRRGRGDVVANTTGTGSPWSASIVVEKKRIRLVSVWIGPLGVAALRLCYGDGSSAVLGKVPAPGDSRIMTQCKIFHKRQRFLVPVEDGSSTTRGFQTPNLRIVDTDLHPRAAAHTWPARYHFRRLMHYLPLRLNVGGRTVLATGLTVYCDPGPVGITGATATFPGDDEDQHQYTQQHVGCYCGVPVHLELALGEQITFVGVFVAMAHDEPIGTPHSSLRGMIVRTNLGRSHLFGGFLPALTGSWSVPLTPIADTPDLYCPVRGLFFDRMSTDGCRWKDVGAHTHDLPVQTQTQTPPQDPDPDQPPPLPPIIDCLLDLPGPPELLRLHAFKRNAFFTALSLDRIDGGPDADGITRLQVCRLGRRCIGLAVTHQGFCLMPTGDYLYPQTTILGQWATRVRDHAAGRPSTTTTETTFHDVDLRGQRLPVLQFVFSKGREYVTDIRVYDKEQDEKQQQEDRAKGIITVDRGRGQQYKYAGVSVVEESITIDTQKDKCIHWFFDGHRDIIDPWPRSYTGFVFFPDQQGVPAQYMPKDILPCDYNAAKKNMMFSLNGVK